MCIKACLAEITVNVDPNSVSLVESRNLNLKPAGCSGVTCLTFVTEGPLSEDSNQDIGVGNGSSIKFDGDVLTINVVYPSPCVITYRIKSWFSWSSGQLVVGASILTGFFKLCSEILF